MFFIGNDVPECPFNLFFKRMFPYVAILFVAYVAGEIKTAICMYKKFYCISKLFFYETDQGVYFYVRLVNV